MNGGIQDVFSIGNTPSICLDLVLRNTSDTVYNMIPINVEIGLNINNKIEYIPLGIFNIDSVKKDDFTIKITAYDNMSKFKVPYFSSLGNTATLTQVANEIAAKTGVQFEGSLPAYTVKKLEGFSCREALSFIASLCGGNAIIKRNGKFTIVYPTDINRDIGEGVFDFTREEVKYKVGKITCKVEDKTLSKGSLGADSMEMQFENPWMNETILADVYKRLNEYEYLGYNLKWQGDPSLDIGDIITYKDDKGVIRKLPIFNRKLSYDGGLDSELSAKGETKNKNSSDSNGSMKKKIDRVVTELAIVNEALIDVAYIGDLTAGNIKFDTASGTIMDLQTLLSKFVSGENGQFLNLTTDNVTISNALIKDVIAKNISAEDLKASVISTNKFRITSDNGGIEIVGATQQFKDKNNKVRIQMGQDTQGNFNFILRGEDGTTTLIDHTGIKEKAIANDLIKSNMVAENAIGEKQINYSSLVTGLNKDTNTQLIKASKVAIDLTGQSLEVAFNSLKSNVDGLEIGGRNLAKKGCLTPYNTNGVTIVDDTTFINDGGAIITRKAQVNDGPMLDRYVEYEKGKKYVISFSMKALSDGINSFHIYNGYNHTEGKVFVDGVEEGKLATDIGLPIDKEYHRIEVHFVAGDMTNKNPDSLGSVHTILQVMKSNVIDYSVQIIGFKIEEGTKATGWTPAPEDIDEKIEANTTAISVTQKGLDALVKDTSIVKGDVTTLKDNYTSIKATVDGINSTVAGHTTSITNAQNTADSKAKVFTSTPTTPYKVGDIWTGGPNGEIMKCKTARASGNYVASDWEKASKYTDDTTANAIGMRVTATETSITQLNNQIALKAEKTYVDNTINGIDSRLKIAETKITADAIVSTVRSSTSYTSDLNAKANQSALNTTNGNVTNLTTRMTTVEQDLTGYKVTVGNTYLSKGDAVNTYATKSSLELTSTQLKVDFSSSGGYNRLRNTEFKMGTKYFQMRAYSIVGDLTGENISIRNDAWTGNRSALNISLKSLTSGQYGVDQSFNTVPGNKYIFTCLLAGHRSNKQILIRQESNGGTIAVKTYGAINGGSNPNDWIKVDIPFTATESVSIVSIYMTSTIGNDGYIWVLEPQVSDGWDKKPWSPNPDEVYSGNTIVDRDGIIIYNGALTVKNKANVEVLKADVNGNLDLTGTIRSNNNDSYVAFDSGGIIFQDWFRKEQILGMKSSVLTGVADRGINGITNVMTANSDYLSFAKTTATDITGTWSSNSILMLVPRSNANVAGGKEGIVAYSPLHVNSTIEMASQFNLNGNTMRLGLSDASPLIYKSPTLDKAIHHIYTGQSGCGFQIQNSDTILFSVRASDYPTEVFTRMKIYGDLAITGSKACLQTTKNYGDRIINAYETAEYYFGDIGSGVIKNGECVIYIDEILQECINTEIEYHVFVQAYEGNTNKIERYNNYFIVYGEEGTKFGWELKGKRLGYENVRLENPSIDNGLRDTSNFELDFIDSNKDIDILDNELDSYIYYNDNSKDILIKEIEEDITNNLLEG